MRKYIKVVSFVVLALLTVLPTKALSKTEKNDDTIVLSKTNLITLNTQVDGESTAKVIGDAKLLDSQLSGIKEKITGNKAHIRLFLNTPGGSIQSGLEMIEALKGLGRPVDTITIFAASMGFQIAQNLDTRYIVKNGVLMSHRAKGEFAGEFGGQNPSQIESRFSLWKSRLDELDQETVNRTGGKQTLQSYQKQYASEMWLTGAQSVAQGYADKVIKVKCDSSLSGTTVHTATVMIFRVTYELDNCPINTTPMNVQIGFATNHGQYMNVDQFLSQGGEFGPYCLVESATNKSKLCSLDTSMNLEKVNELKAQFLNQYFIKMRHVVDML